MVDSPFALPIFQLSPARPPLEVHAPAIERGALCTSCPLFGCNQGPIMGEIRPNAAMTIVGEAPGPKELLAKRPFHGWSGQILEAAIAGAGLTREDCSITNTTLCMPLGEGGNYKAYTDILMAAWKRRVRAAEKRGEDPPPPPMLPQQACAPRLARDIAESNAKVVLAVGKQGLEACAREMHLPHGSARIQAGDPYVASIAKQHGAPVLHPDGRILMSSYHPAMAAPGRGRSEYLRVIRENLMRAAWVARHGGHIPWIKPQAKINPTVDEVLAFCARLRATNAETTIDIETDSVDTYTALIRCVGMGAYLGPDGREEAIMVVPIRHMDGTRWFSEEDTLRIAYAIREVVDNNPLVMQNGPYDTAVMLNRRLMTNRQKSWVDTMILHKNTPDNDLPHNLGFIARRFFCFSMWKGDIDHKSVDNVDDAVLHKYNGDGDVAVTMRLVEPLRREVTQWNTWPQQETDTALLPITRDMGDLGLVIDEAKRGEFSEVLNWQAQRELYKFREIIGKPKFNPRSVPQLQELIFSEWDYLPVIGMDGYEIKWPEPGAQDWRQQVLAEGDFDDLEAEGEIGSTSSSALTELMKKRDIAPAHVEALKTLLEYRAYDKLRGTYVDSMRVRAIDWASLGEDVGWLQAARAIVWNKDTEDYRETELIGPRQALSLLNTVYKLQVTPTGRLASSPNVQNWPALGKANMRDMVVAPPGHVLVLGDFAQLEARLYALVAGDELLLQTIREGRDIHSANAAALLAKNPSELNYWYEKIEKGDKKYRKFWRTIAKRFVFLIVYGGEDDRLLSVMAQQRDKETGELSFPDIKRSDIETWLEGWHRLHPWTRLWHYRCAQKCEATGYASVAAIDYRKRFFLDGASKKNAICNMEIQGEAASLANRALRRLVEAIPFRSWSYWTGVNLQVHDALGVMVPESRADETKAIMAKCMNSERGGIAFPAEISVARRWSKLD